MKKFWTEEKNDYLINNIGAKDYSRLAANLGITEIALKVQAKRLGIKLRCSYVKHNFISQVDLIKECKEKGFYITHDILLSWRKNKVIKAYKPMKGKGNGSTVLYSEDTYNWIMDFLSKNIILSEVKKNTKRFSSRMWKDIVRTRTNLREFLELKYFNNSNIWISKEKYKLILALDSCLTTKELAEKVFYSVTHLNFLKRKGLIKPFMTFRNKDFYTKENLEIIKNYQVRGC